MRKGTEDIIRVFSIRNQDFDLACFKNRLEIKFKGKITGVEIDAEIIKIANSYFHLDEIQNFKVVIDDAFEFVLKTKEKYDLIIIDIFQDTKMPNFLFEAFFQNRTCFLLKEKGVILFNTMCLSEKENLRNKTYLQNVSPDFLARTIPRVEDHNELIILERK